MTKRSAILALTIGLIAFSGCRKTLTPAFALTLTQSYIDAEADPEKLKHGRMMVDSCDRLLLDSETSASATCKTHIAFTSAGLVAFGRKEGDEPVTGSVRVSFGKTPDGKWVATTVQY